MAELKTEDNSARPNLGRAFLERLSLALPDSKAQLTFWSLLVVGLVLDLWTKKAVFDWLDHHRSFSIINGFLQLVRVLNNGAAFGILAGKPYLLTAISVVALVAIFTVFLFSRSQQRLVHIALGLFAAGVCGNLYDRIFNDGLVRDFIDVYYGRYHWPAFNVADSLLCIGVGLLLISTLFTGKSSRRRAQQHK
jgi:signal peptidase II